MRLKSNRLCDQVLFLILSSRLRRLISTSSDLAPPVCFFLSSPLDEAVGKERPWPGRNRCDRLLSIKTNRKYFPRQHALQDAGRLFRLRFPDRRQTYAPERAGQPFRTSSWKNAICP